MVRRATIADLDAVAPLFDAYRQFYRQPADLALARQFLKERLERSESIIFVAENPEAVGFTQLYPSFSSVSAAPILVLNDLFVSPEARRQKVASLLLAAAAQYGHETGAVRLVLSTEAKNITAQALYESEGWVRETDFYYNFAL